MWYRELYRQGEGSETLMALDKAKQKRKLNTGKEEPKKPRGKMFCYAFFIQTRRFCLLARVVYEERAHRNGRPCLLRRKENLDEWQRQGLL